MTARRSILPPRRERKGKNCEKGGVQPASSDKPLLPLETLENKAFRISKRDIAFLSESTENGQEAILIRRPVA